MNCIDATQDIEWTTFLDSRDHTIRDDGEINKKLKSDID